MIQGAGDMMKKEYPPLEFLVDGLLPKTSLVTLNANPKTGKSLWTEQLASSVADTSIDEFIGHKVCIHGQVLLLALEDTPQRLAERLKKQSVGQPGNGLHICTRWTSGEEGIKDLQLYLSTNSDIVLVIIDTLQTFRANALANDYALDYLWMNKLKRIADERGICIILVHHLRKTRNEGEDEICQISGTMGISGVADTNIILERKRRSFLAEMNVSGRDVPDYKDKLRLNPMRLIWSKISEKELLADEKVTPERRAILAALEELGGRGTPKEIAATTNDDNKNVSNKLAMMVANGIIRKSEKKSGLYELLETNTEENTHEIR